MSEILYFYRAGLSYTEIAKLFDKTYSWAYQKIERELRSLEREMNGDYDFGM